MNYYPAYCGINLIRSSRQDTGITVALGETTIHFHSVDEAQHFVDKLQAKIDSNND